MNIIQQQERLKRLPEEAVIEYIANPTGEIPTFLAMGEIERRKVMRNKYAAQQAERPSISEQIVQESMAAKMPQAMPQPPMPQAMPQPPMPSSGDAGITALPAPNVGQNYAQGGVVGYAAGDYVVLTPAQKEANKRAIRDLNNYYAAPKLQPREFDEVLGEFVLTDYEASTEPTGITKPNIFGAAGPFGSTAYDNYVSGLKGLTHTEDNPSPISLFGRERLSGREITFDPNIPPASYDPETGNVIGLDRVAETKPELGIAGVSVGEERFTSDQLADQKRFNAKTQENQAKVAAEEKIIRDKKLEAAGKEAGTVTGTGQDAISDAGKDAISDYTNLFDIESSVPLTAYERYRQSQADYGMDENYYTRLREDIESDRDLVRDRSDVANMALINAGLGIASGTSQNALENIARGAVPGLTSYTQGLKDLRDDERGIRKELRGVDALQRGESREDMMLDKKLRNEIKAAQIAGQIRQRDYELAAQTTARDRVNDLFPDGAASVSDSVVKALGYEGENRKQKYINDLYSAFYKQTLLGQTLSEQKLNDKERNLIRSMEK